MRIVITLGLMTGLCLASGHAVAQDKGKAAAGSKCTQAADCGPNLMCHKDKKVCVKHADTKKGNAANSQPAGSQPASSQPSEAAANASACGPNQTPAQCGLCCSEAEAECLKPLAQNDASGALTCKNAATACTDACPK